MAIAFSFEPTLAAPKRDRYGFLNSKLFGESSLTLLDPNDFAHLEVRKLPVPDGEQLLSRVISGSPGQWVALLYSAGQESLMRLVNLTSGATLDIARGGLSTLSSDYVGPDQNIVWSPDQHLLAFNMTNTFIYSIADRSLVQLVTDKPNPSRLAWSQDSMHLAIESEYCSDTCHLTIESFNVGTHTREISADVSAFSQGSSFIGATLCAFNLSPTGRYISFVSSCVPIPDLPKDLYVYDLQNRKVTRLTNLTTEMLKDKDVVVVEGDYHTYWFDDQTLLIGLLTRSNKSNQTQTIVFHLPEGTSTTLLTEGVQEWSVNSSSGELAFRSISTIDLMNGTPHDPSVKVGIFKKDTLNTSLNLSAGCNLAWSPDGLTLAYTRHTDSKCANNVESIMFVDRATGNQTEYNVPPYKVEDGDQVIPLGWVAESSAK